MKIEKRKWKSERLEANRKKQIPSRNVIRDADIARRPESGLCRDDIRKLNQNPKSRQDAGGTKSNVAKRDPSDTVSPRP